MMRHLTLLSLLAVAAGCGHTHDAEVVAAVEQRATIGYLFTADTTRLEPDAQAGQQALAALLSSQLAAVGQLRDRRAAGDHLDLVADLPAPGWALRVRITPKPEQLCQVAIEPVAIAPDEHTVVAAPWSVHDAFEQLHRQAGTLRGSTLPPMDAARFARLRAEAAAAAREGRDPPLTPSEYVRVPRALSAEGVDRPYYTPPSEASGLQGP